MTIKDTIKRTIQGLATTKDGAEICDPKPRSIPTGIKRPPTQEQRLQRILQAHRIQQIEDAEYADETDFDIDEPDMLTPYERSATVFDMEPQIPVEDSTESLKEPATPTAEDSLESPQVSSEPETKE